MKLCYVTCEGYYSDPIIQSQVDPLLTSLRSAEGGVAYAELITFEVRGNEKRSTNEGDASYVRKMFTRKSHLRNLLAIFLYLVRHGRAFDVVHCRSYLPMLPVLLAAPLFRFKVVFDPRGLFADELLYYKQGSILGKIFKSIERWLYRSADRVITVSDVFSRYVDRHYGVGQRTQMISTFGRGTTTEVASVDIRHERGWQDKVILCYSGSLEGWQCIDDVIAFFKLALSISPRFVVLILSKSETEFRARLGTEFDPSRYHVMSASPSQLPAILSQCDYGVLFREDHIVNRVAAPIKLKDYLCAGIKVVLSPNIGDAEQMVGEFDLGYIVDKNSRSAQLAALEHMRILESEDKIRIAAFARSFFDISRAVEGYKNVYRSMLALGKSNEK